MHELTTENFVKETGKGNVAVDFWAPWCGPCKLMEPVFETVSKEHPGIKFFKLNVDEHPAIASQHSVMSIPTVLFLKDGEVVDHAVGFVSKQAFTQKVKQAFG